MPFVLPPWINLAALATVIVAAALVGAAEERIYAGWLALEWLGGKLFLPPHLFGEHIAAHLAIEAAEALVLCVLALRFDRLWLLIAAAVAVTESATTGAQLLIHAQSWAYGTAIVAWTHMTNALLGVGTWRSWRRRRAAAQADRRLRAATATGPARR